jgi:hypothetical protein
MANYRYNTVQIKNKYNSKDYKKVLLQNTLKYKQIISKYVHSIAADAHLAEGQFLCEEPTVNKGKSNNAV